MKMLRCVVAVICMIICVIIVACSDRDDDEGAVSRETFMLDTVISITLYHNEDDGMFTRLFDEIGNLEDVLSIHRETSDLYRIRQYAGHGYTVVSPEAIDVIKKSLTYASATGGLFDVTAGPLIELWGIGTEAERVPSQAEIAAAISKIDYRKVEIDDKNSAIMLADEGMFIDLGAVAKGYIADKAADSVEREGIKNAIINLGGNIRLIGSKPDGSDFRIGIQDPDGARGKYLGILDVSNTSVVTSGNYERYFIQDGIRYHHILNPFTGYPENNGLKSVSIVTKNSTDADALSTSVLLLGYEKGYEFVNELADVEAIFVTDDNQVTVTAGLKDRFELTSKNYSLR